MSYRSSYGSGSPFGVSITPMVKRLLIINAGVFLVAFLLENFTTSTVVRDLLGFSPARFLTRPWTLLTYAFTHVGIFHVFFNLLMLFFFGPPLEGRWGSQPFLRYYLVAAAGGAVFSLMQPYGYVIGASGAIYGLMLAFAMAWPNMPIHVFGIFPVPAKWLVGGMAVISVLYIIAPQADGVAHWAHLGGFVTGFLYLKSQWGPSPWGELPARSRKPKRTPSAILPWMENRKPSEGREVPAAAPARPRAAAARRERELLDDVDRILDKISEQGIASLTEDERKRLDEVSRKRRTN
jgi:membrane associated rhomboid family serine protease